MRTGFHSSWRWVYLLLALPLGGCKRNFPMVPGLGTVPNMTHGTGGDPFLIALTWIAIAAAVLAAVSVVASIYLPGPKMRATAGTLIALAVCAWVLRVLLAILAVYLWWLALVAAVAGLAFGALYLYGHRWWFEKPFGINLDSDPRLGRPD